ncbi:hypothetical protein NYA30BAC_01524 [Halomonas sp. NYA30]
MMDRLFTREPSFCGNTGYNGNTQQPRGLQPLPINKRGGNKGNTYLYIYRAPDFVCCRFKKAATGCQKIPIKSMVLPVLPRCPRF